MREDDSDEKQEAAILEGTDASAATDTITFYKDAFKAVYRNMLGKGCNHDDASDFAAKAVNAVMERIDQISEEGRLSYAFTVADNAWKDHRKKKSTCCEVYVDMTDPSFSETVSESMERPVEKIALKRVERKRQKILVENELKGLSEDEQKIIRLYRDGVDYKTIAKHLNRMPKTIANRLSNIREKIRAALMLKGDLD